MTLIMRLTIVSKKIAKCSYYITLYIILNKAIFQFIYINQINSNTCIKNC